MEIREEILNIVSHFRRRFNLVQDDVLLHHKLFDSEFLEYLDATNVVEKADGLADMAVVAAGGILDGFSNFNNELDYSIELANVHSIDILRAVKAVDASNTTKLCTLEQITPTADKYAAIGVPAHFEPVDELDESAGFRCLCASTAIGEDGNEYPAGKLLKSVGYQEPDFSYLGVV